MIAVETCVLEPFGHDGAGKLLKLHGERKKAVAAAVGLLASCDQEDPAHKVVDAGVLGVVLFLGRLNRDLDVPAGLARDFDFVRFAFSKVCSVHGKISYNFAQGVAEAIQSEVAGIAVRQCDTAQHAGQNLQLTGERTAHDSLLGFVDDLAKVESAAQESTIGAPHFGRGGRVDEETVEQIGKVVTCSPMHGPIRRQRLIAGQNLFNHYVTGAAGGDLPEVLCGIEQPVRMIDSQSVDFALPHQFHDEAVRSLEDARIFHAQTGEIVDVKKTPVVNIVGCDPPIPQPERLRLDQFMQFVKAAGVADGTVNSADVLPHKLRNRCRSRTEVGKSSLEDFLVPISFGAFFLSGRGAPGEVAKG